MLDVPPHGRVRFGQAPWPALDRWVILLGWMLAIAILLHHVILIYIVPWGSPASLFFGETQLVIFGGFVGILVLTLHRMPAQRPLGYRWACYLMLLAQVLLFVGALLRARGPDGPTYHTLSMLLFVAVHLCSVWALAPMFPWRDLPRLNVLRLSADTALVLALVNMLFQLLLPVLVSPSTPTPLIALTQFRLVASIGLCYWYIEAYRRFGCTQLHFLVFAGCGLGFMLINDVALMWAVIEVTAGASGKWIRATGVLWMYQQICWVMALYWAMRSPLQWESEKRRDGAKPLMWAWQTRWWRVPANHGTLLTGLVLIACSISPSLTTTLWIVAALLSREAVIRHEQAQAQRQAEALAAEQERGRIARDLHDSVKHILTNVRWQAVVGQEVSEADPEAIPAILGEIRLQAEQGLDEVHRVVRTLRGLSPVAPLLQQVETLAHGFHQARVIPVVLGEERVLSTEHEDQLLLIVKEALTNVAKYAHATQVIVQLDYQDVTCMRLVIQDDGCGVRHVYPGTGLKNMQWRAERLGGHVKFYPNPGRGFCIVVEVPT